MEGLALWEGTALLWLQDLRGPWNSLIIYYTHLGDGGFFWLTLSCLLLADRRTRRVGRLALLALVLGFVLTNLVLKPLVDRPRPWVEVAGLLPLVALPQDASFPSGHTCAAFAASLVWARLLPGRNLARLAVVLAVAMGLSRLYVGVHYPSDVAVGALIGSLSAYLALRWR